MEYLLQRKKQNLGLFFTYNDPFASMIHVYSCSYATSRIPAILNTIQQNYKIQKNSSKGGIEVDYYLPDSSLFWDKNRKLMHHVKNNTLTLLVENGVPRNLRPTWDKTTDARILTLDPRMQNPTREFINTVEEELGIQLRINQAYRSIAEQDALYNQGRSTPGPIVTKARGGTSYHNYALAIDVVMIKNGQAVWTPVPKEVVDIGKRLGFEWGGDWKKFKDKPHFQMTFGKSIKELRSQSH